MPTQTLWVKPAIYLVHNNVTIFRTYIDNDVDKGVSDYWFTTDENTDGKEFDIRVLVPEVLAQQPPYKCARANPAYATATQEEKALLDRRWEEWMKSGGLQEKSVRAALISAIDRGLITALVNV